MLLYEYWLNLKMEELMEKTKQCILSLWHQVNRPGIEDLIKFLQEGDFFTAQGLTLILYCQGASMGQEISSMR